MKQKTRIVSLLVCLCLCVAMLTSAVSAGDVSTDATTTTVEPRYTYYILQLDMDAWGATDRSYDREKLYDPDYAYVDIDTYSCASSYCSYIRVRTSSGSYATEVDEVTQANPYDLYYYSGYGNVGSYYYLKAQTSSNSAYSASIRGSWRP